MSDTAEQSAPSVEVGRRAAQRAERRLLIDGKLRAAISGDEFDNVSPATGRVLGTTAAAGAADMDAAIAAARRAFDETDWAVNRALRKRCLEQLQSALESESDDLREELVAEVGCPIVTTRDAQLDWPLAGALRWPARHDRRVRVGTGARRWRAVRRAQRAHRGQGARRRRRRDHPVELPHRGHPQQARPGAGDGQHRHPQARPEHPVERHPVGPAHRRAHRHPAGGGQRRPDPGQRRGGTSGDRPARGHGVVHRVDRGGQADHPRRCRDHEANLPGTGRQVGADRARRRQAVARHPGRGRGVRARRAGVRVDHPAADSPVAVRRGGGRHPDGVRGRSGRRPGAARDVLRAGDQRRTEAAGARRVSSGAPRRCRNPHGRRRCRESARVSGRRAFRGTDR